MYLLFRGESYNVHSSLFLLFLRIISKNVTQFMNDIIYVWFRI